MQLKSAMMMGAVALAALAGSAAQAVAPRAPCTILNTTYVQPGNPGVTAGFAKPKVQSSAMTDLVFWLKADGQTFWYRLSSPNGYGGLFITPQRNPAELVEDKNGEMPDDRLPGMIPAEGEEEGDYQMMFDAFDAKLDAFASPPTSKDRPPAYLYTRELGRLFHYMHMSELYKLKTRVGIDIAMWRPVSCNVTKKVKLPR